MKKRLILNAVICLIVGVPSAIKLALSYFYPWLQIETTFDRWIYGDTIGFYGSMPQAEYRATLLFCDLIPFAAGIGCGCLYFLWISRMIGFQERGRLQCALYMGVIALVGFFGFWNLAAAKVAHGLSITDFSVAYWSGLILVFIAMRPSNKPKTTHPGALRQQRDAAPIALDRGVAQSAGVCEELPEEKRSPRHFATRGRVCLFASHS